MGAYALSKTALLGLTKLMAMELGPRGVRVNCICPGLIETNFGAAVSYSNSQEYEHFFENGQHLMFLDHPE